MADQRVYWMWLQECFGPGSIAPAQIYENFPGGIEGFWKAGPESWHSLLHGDIQRLKTLKRFSLQAAQERLEQAESRGWQVLTPESTLYPPALRNISDPPAALYVRGHWPDFSASAAVAVVGARKALPASRTAAGQIASQLAAGGVTIVGGNAVGIDESALSVALKAGGRVVSVLPVDLNSPYVTATAPLRRKILAEGGALVTEYFNQRSPQPGTFQCRNRIVAGLCLGVVVIQAKMHSGTMIYATCAANQGREVFVYPGPQTDSMEFAGSRALLEDGATPVRNGMDVLRNIPVYYRDKTRAKYLQPHSEAFPPDVVPQETR